MKEKLNELKQRYLNAKTDLEKEDIDKQMQLLISENADEWANAMCEQIKDTADAIEIEVQRYRVKEQIKDLSDIIPFSYIAKNYFNKSRQWLSQRINEHTVNGKSVSLTEEEIEIFNKALQDISNKIGSVKIA